MVTQPTLHLFDCVRDILKYLNLNTFRYSDLVVALSAIKMTKEFDISVSNSYDQN